TYVTLNGTLTAPEQVESSLLGNTLQNTDSQVRTAFKTAKVYVNGSPVSTFQLSDMASSDEWPLKIENAPESATGMYSIDVVAGQITLRSKVRDSEKSDFSINLETTAAALLAETVGREQNELLTTYPAFVNTIKNVLIASAQKTTATLAVGSIVNDAAVVAALASQTAFLKSIANLTTTARFAYLQAENDLDGDGKYDVYVKPNASGERVSFYTALSSDTSMREGVDSLDSYTDAELLADFADPEKLSQLRTFGTGAPKTILGMYFKKSASGDKYLKMYIHSIDITDGDFNGVLVEYGFVATATTAISKGQKTLMHKDSALIEGAVYATNFLDDSDESAGNLSFLGAANGIGSTDSTRMVLVIDGQPELDKLTSAPEWLTNGGNYYFNTADSLKNELYSTKVLEIGDVFAAYFPADKHYALFKINWLGEDRVVVDYIVNASEDERRFK
ncbi:MAG: hypothetical protein ACD_39C01641G0002, partial [uncultured bacterium]